MIRLRSVGLIVALALLAGAGRAGDEAPSSRAEKPRRTFEPHRILVRGDRLLVVGVAAALGGDPDRGCDRPRELAVREIDSRGRLREVTEFPRERFGRQDCIETIETAFLDRGTVLVSGWAAIRDPAYNGADRYPYAARLRLGEGPDVQFGDQGFLGLPHPTAGLTPFGHDLLYAGGVRFDSRGEVLDESAFTYSGANGRVAPLAGGRVAVVLFDEGKPSYHLRVIRPGKVGPTTTVVAARSTDYAEVTHLAPVGGGLFVLMENDTTNEVVHRHRADGRLLRDFGRRGRVDAHPGRGRHENVTGIAATQRGGLVTTGELQERGRRKAFATRFDPRGRRLTSSVLDIGPADDNVYTDAVAVAVQPDGKIVVAASVKGRVGKLLRLLPGGRPDPEFGKNGVVTLTLS